MLKQTWINPRATEPGEIWRIDIYADRKVRFYDRGSPTTGDRIGANDTPDPWVLYRYDVSALTDAEWHADPWQDTRTDGRQDGGDRS